ncbi:LysE family translocator [Streptomyces cucumeris]|uniref:LysE family translocator n=1 Tax=Streptomyces cucumeris TaxID=2962890 RepID=UPI003D756E3C
MGIRPAALIGFVIAVLPLVATPGASLTLLIQHVTATGRRRAVPVVLGTVSGLYVHAALALAGLAALVTHSAVALTTVKVAGAGYLVLLGVWTWRSASRPPGTAPASRRREGASRSVWAQALFANVLNPKAASIYLTLVPQFLSARDPVAGQILVLATAHALLITLWLLSWSLLIGRFAPALRHSVRPRIARASAAVLVGLGVWSVVT